MQLHLLSSQRLLQGILQYQMGRSRSLAAIPGLLQPEAGHPFIGTVGNELEMLLIDACLPEIEHPAGISAEGIASGMEQGSIEAAITPAKPGSEWQGNALYNFVAVIDPFGIEHTAAMGTVEAVGIEQVSFELGGITYGIVRLIELYIDLFTGQALLQGIQRNVHLVKRISGSSLSSDT